MDDIARVRLQKGRGAGTNATGRYEHEKREAFDDGWGASDEAPPRLPTRFTRDSTRSIIARNDSPDIPFDHSINPYRGCEHGCIYCFARPTHAYLGLSPGLDFESKILVKEQAPALLAAELRKPSYRCRPIALGTNTDPYQPAERHYRIMRGILEVLRDFRHPVTVVTKSALIQRDIDILADMAKDNLAACAVSVTTLDRKLARVMEPRAATPERRLEAIAALTRAGIPTSVMAAPMIPALNDVELEVILERSVDAGARGAGYTMLRLPLEVAPLFIEWLNDHFPAKAKHVMSLVREGHGGKDYDPHWGKRMTGSGPYAELLRIRFETACRRLRLNLNRGRLWRLDTGKFAAPPAPNAQLNLF
ncbi:MAG: PA0069 family radical SAM protein [Alphaproteobacteria bacterium]|nr:PA0069 family radical SAM protein [Alphaproteobacteria bacterium]